MFSTSLDEPLALPKDLSEVVMRMTYLVLLITCIRVAVVQGGGVSGSCLLSVSSSDLWLFPASLGDNAEQQQMLKLVLMGFPGCK